jgi:hypothetical protein
MLHAKKAALENSARQRLVAIRWRELEYFTNNCRAIGNAAAIVAGLAYSGIRYHYLLERNSNFLNTLGNSLEECIFLTLLAITIGCALQTVYVSMLVALFGGHLALRGPDGALHDAIEGMHKWNSVVLALFFTSLFLLQLSAFSLMYGHSALTLPCRVILCATVALTIFASLRYARIVMLRLRVPKEARVTGAFFIDGRGQGDCFKDAADDRAPLCSARAPKRQAQYATRIDGDESEPLTAESLDAAVRCFAAEGAAGSIASAPSASQGRGLLPREVGGVEHTAATEQKCGVRWEQPLSAGPLSDAPKPAGGRLFAMAPTGAAEHGARFGSLAGGTEESDGEENAPLVTADGSCSAPGTRRQRGRRTGHHGQEQEQGQLPPVVVISRGSRSSKPSSGWGGLGSVPAGNEIAFLRRLFALSGRGLIK